MPVLLWRDMFLFGTALNVTFLALAFTAAGAGMPDWTALLIFLLPLPYNLFIWSSVWRKGGGMSTLECYVSRSIACLWLGASLVV
ncbi:hypothetical protein LJR030_004785 [Rhizobium sp. LjRoot30]|uniref:hypothetical protein n=1 Tax=Rhizobium sp. LjRoot30 TaxID=3342320 RepID=UPI003ECDFF03